MPQAPWNYSLPHLTEMSEEDIQAEQIQRAISKEYEQSTDRQCMEVFPGPIHQSKAAKSWNLGCNNESLDGYFILTYLQHLPQGLILCFLYKTSRSSLYSIPSHCPELLSEMRQVTHTIPGESPRSHPCQLLWVDPSRRLTDILPHHLDHQSSASIPPVPGH